MFNQYALKGYGKLSKMITKKGDYNNVPIDYCKSCLKIKIKEVDLNSSKGTKVSYCGDCGSTEIDSAHVTEWEEKYVERYGKKFLDE